MKIYFFLEKLHQNFLMIKTAHAKVICEFELMCFNPI